MLNKNRNESLDLVRGLSAVAVLAGHLRALVFQDFGNLAAPGVFGKIFYFATGLGHQAVMVFFVLSGYFVGGGVCKALAGERFRWLNYGSARLVRLWMALLPALFLTLVCDLVGRHSTPEAYNGSLLHLFNSGPGTDGSGYTAGSFLGSMIFLQTISVSCFGSNVPLWSLANEFWYYVLFPLAACGVASLSGPNRRMARVLGMWAAFALIAWLLPGKLVFQGLIWLLGVGVWWASTRPALLRIASHPLYGVATGGIFLGCLVLSKTHSPLGSDFGVGTAFALWVCNLLGPCSAGALVKRVGGALSEFSYTLYVVHFPIQFLIATMLFKGHKFSFGPAGGLWYIALFLVSVGASVLMWSLFERRTDVVRQWALRLFQKQDDKPKSITHANLA